jgi:glutaredoxin
MEEPFYIREQIKKAFDSITLPTIQIDYIHISNTLKPE